MTSFTRALQSEMQAKQKTTKTSGDSKLGPHTGICHHDSLLLECFPSMSSSKKGVDSALYVPLSLGQAGASARSAPVRVHLSPVVPVRTEADRKKVFGDPGAASLGV